MCYVYSFYFTNEPTGHGNEWSGAGQKHARTLATRLILDIEPTEFGFFPRN